MPPRSPRHAWRNIKGSDYQARVLAQGMPKSLWHLSSGPLDENDRSDRKVPYYFFARLKAIGSFC